MFLKIRCNIPIIILFFVSKCNTKTYSKRNSANGNAIGEGFSEIGLSDSDVASDTHPLTGEQRQCWMRLDSQQHFQIMDKLDESYEDVRKEYQDAVRNDNFDREMLSTMVKSRGAAKREIYKAMEDTGHIPAGINLGGYCMMRMVNSLLFFHRMKLRNNTHFHVTQLHTDLINMVLIARISLNDIHLLGSYDRTVTDKDPSVLYYTPTYGQVEFLLKNAQYNMEGRYRLLKDRLTIELIISEISIDDVMMTYLNNPANKPIRLQKENIDEFLDRLKIDLDKWVKDYFNDYLMYFGLIGNKTINSKFQQYDKEKAIELNDFTDHAINLISRRLRETKTGSVKLPKFTIFTANGMKLALRDGVLRGLDSMYRRSVATGKKGGDIRKVDAVVGFSYLKASYKYDALLSTNSLPLSGTLILSADELTARLGMAFVTDPESMDLQFEFMEQAKPESLTVEGAANRVISNFKYLLEQHVISIMSNTLIHNIKLLSTLTRCTPILPGYHDANYLDSEDDGRITNKEIREFSTTLSDSSVESSTLDNVKDQKPDNQKDEKTGQSDDTSKERDDIETMVDKNETSKVEEPNKEIEESVPVPDMQGKKYIVLKEDSAELELSSNENEKKQRVHVKFVKNLTVTHIKSR